jgi:hypothetical protein
MFIYCSRHIVAKLIALQILHFTVIVPCISSDFQHVNKVILMEVENMLRPKYKAGPIREMTSQF